MNIRKLIVLFVFQIVFLSSCAASNTDTGPKMEVSSYMEKSIDKRSFTQLDMNCDVSNVQVFTWDKKSIKFEVTKRLRGCEEKSILEEKLKNFDVEISHDESKVFFKSQYKNKDKEIEDVFIDLKVYLPKINMGFNWEQKKGNIKFYDDIKGVFNASTDMVNMDMNKFEGVININSKDGNVKISSGRIAGKSSIVKGKGCISIKSEFEENGDYNFMTDVGNIDLSIPQNCPVSFESIGTLEQNEFDSSTHPTKIKLSCSIGKISIKKF